VFKAEKCTYNKKKAKKDGGKLDFLALDSHWSKE
jgi:hypothetical protein